MNELLCFQHCEKENIFCLQLPSTCPICTADLTCADLRIPPFRVPSPFDHVPSTFGALNLLLKPTFGSFMDYKNGEPLHVGINNSKTIIYAYDENGVQCFENWPTCLTVCLVSNLKDLERLDLVLERAASSPTSIWIRDKYDEHQHNCFDFVVSALNEWSSDEGRKWTKSGLTEEHILPAVKKVVRLVSIYRAVIKDGWFFQRKDNDN